MNPWADVGQAPECPRCEIATEMYLWEFEDPDKFYCARCRRIYDMKKGRDIGGQQTIC